MSAFKEHSAELEHYEQMLTQAVMEELRLEREERLRMR